MAQPRNRPAVTVTLDPTVLNATRELLATFPGSNLTFSRLVENLLREFVRGVSPMVDELRELANRKEPVDSVEVLRVIDAVFGRGVADMSQAYTAVRTKAEGPKGE